jgi:hypothetical protein
VLRIRIRIWIRIRRIRVFLGLLDQDPDPLVRGIDLLHRNTGSSIRGNSHNCTFLADFFHFFHLFSPCWLNSWIIFRGRRTSGIRMWYLRSSDCWVQYELKFTRTNVFTESLTRDFRLHVFFMNQFPRGLWVYHGGHLKFYENLRDTRK